VVNKINDKPGWKAYFELMGAHQQQPAGLHGRNQAAEAGVVEIAVAHVFI